MKMDTNILALGRRWAKHDDGDAIGYVEVDARNVVFVTFELVNCILALVLLMADNDEDGLDANDDVVELDSVDAAVV